MLKKSSTNSQLGLFTTPSSFMCKRESKQYDDELEWHSQFFTTIIVDSFRTSINKVIYVIPFILVSESSV